MNDGLSHFDEPDPRESIPGYVDLYELFTSSPYEEVWIASHLVPQGRMIALVGPAKSGKSLLALNCAAAIASGRHFLGKPTIQSTVLYIDQENIPHLDIKPRLEKMGYQWEDLDEHLIYSSYGDFADFNTAKGANQLMDVIREHGVQVVIIDTISRVVTGKENDNDTWNDLHKHLERRLKDEGISLLRIDHTGKDTDKGPRGGSAKLGDVDMTLMVIPGVNAILRLYVQNSRMMVNWTKAELQIIKEPILDFAIREVLKETSEERLQRLIALLDSKGVSSNMTVQETRQELKALGEGASNDMVSAVTKQRKKARTTSPRQERQLHTT
jgi:nicotinamide riboside kinase